MTKEALKLAAEMERGQFSTTLLPAAAELRRLHEENRKLRAQEALDKKAENARELGLDYEPEQEPVAKKMTARCAAYFMERFKHEEKLLGPNEQAALDFVISTLKAQPEQEPVAKVKRKLLTNEEISDLWCKVSNTDFVAEDLTKLPSGDYQNSHTGVRSSKPPAKKKRGEKTWAEWDAIEKAKKEQGVVEEQRTWVGLTDEFVNKVVRSKQPHLDTESKAWKDNFAECKYWLEAAHGIKGEA